MTDKDYKDLIYSIVVPQNMPQEEQNVRYQPLIDFLQTETPSSLYRFRECSENNISAFDQDQLWFTPGSEMNDDFDALLFLDRNTIYSNLERSLISFGAEIPNSVSNSFADDIATSVQAQFKQMSESEINEFRKQLHCFLVNRLDANMPRIEHIIQSVLKLACFSETIDSAAMWGYYAKSGTGFALAYDFRNQNYTDCTLCEKRFFCPSAKTGSLFRVIYDDIPFDATGYGTWLLQYQIAHDMVPNKQFANLSSLLSQTNPCPDLFMSSKIILHKSTSWRHEKEWRMIYSCNPQINGQEKFVWAKKRPTAVYLGRKISPFNEKLLRHIAVEKGIPVYKMEMNHEQSSYKLVPRPI